MRLPVRITSACLLLCACSKTSSPGELVDAPAPAPTPIEVRVGQPELLFSYRSPAGGFRTATTAAAIPEAARSSVVVVDLSLSPEERGSTRYVHVADLRAPDAEGRFPVAVASRHAFARGHGAEGEAAPGASTSAPVVVYSASWCGVCKKAKRLLRELRVPFEDKDIEASRSALEELGAKARRAGLRPSGVPVIDVKGRLMQGLDVPRLKAMLREAELLGS